MAKAKKKDEPRLLRGPVFRSWVEVKDTRDSSMRTIQLAGFRRICIPVRKCPEVPPSEDGIRVHDDPAPFDVMSLDELKVKLRERYPDEYFERRLCQVRDEAEEERQEKALRDLQSAFSKMAIGQAYRVVLRHLEAMMAEGYSDADFKIVALERSLTEMRSGKWRADRHDTYGLEDWIIVALEAMRKSHGIGVACDDE